MIQNEYQQDHSCYSKQPANKNDEDIADSDDDVVYHSTLRYSDGSDGSDTEYEDDIKEETRNLPKDDQLNENEVYEDIWRECIGELPHKPVSSPNSSQLEFAKHIFNKHDSTKAVVKSESNWFYKGVHTHPDLSNMKRLSAKNYNLRILQQRGKCN